MSIISNHSKFTEIFDSISVFSTKIEEKINNFLWKLEKSNKISDEINKKTLRYRLLRPKYPLWKSKNPQAQFLSDVSPPPHFRGL